MREEFIVSDEAAKRSRITPAHAGRMYFAEQKYLHLQDHPRACGKNTKKFHKYSYSLPITSINLFTFIDN